MEIMDDDSLDEMETVAVGEIRDRIKVIRPVLPSEIWTCQGQA
jgi:hypothetical protein